MPANFYPRDPSAQLGVKTKIVDLGISNAINETVIRTAGLNGTMN